MLFARSNGQRRASEAESLTAKKRPRFAGSSRFRVAAEKALFSSRWRAFFFINEGGNRFSTPVPPSCVCQTVFSTEFHVVGGKEILLDKTQKDDKLIK